ncbi:MAG: hypothetical protein FWF90_05630 [Promicromonosporaceae bacterium]|nr:hypothetical protein [Promicromonosporaceae bacterium]
MPALNTIQFSWLKNLMPQHAQPVPPIYEPEVGAAAVGRMAAHPRRELWVGAPTVLTILGNRLAPGLLDAISPGPARARSRPTPTGSPRSAST